MFELKIRKIGCRNFSLCKMPLRFKRRYKNIKFKEYGFKLGNSVSRAKNKIFDYALNNEFTYFVTLTINSNYDRFDLNSFRKKVSQIIRDMRRRGFTNLNYILIPEKHKNGAWHFHGFFSSGFGADFYVNDNGFLSWLSFDPIGFSSFSRIKNDIACAKYITKYVNKEMCKALKGQYLYFHSQGLKSSVSCGSIITSGLLPIKFDYENNYVSKVLLNNYDYFTFIDFLYSNNKIISSDVQY